MSPATSTGVCSEVLAELSLSVTLTGVCSEVLAELSLSVTLKMNQRDSCRRVERAAEGDVNWWCRCAQPSSLRAVHESKSRNRAESQA